MVDYSNLYLATDTFLLAEIFEKYRTLVLREFHLDPSFYLGVPSLSFDIMLYMSRAELELPTRPVHEFLNRGLRLGYFCAFWWMHNV